MTVQTIAPATGPAPEDFFGRARTGTTMATLRTVGDTLVDTLVDTIQPMTDVLSDSVLRRVVTVPATLRNLVDLGQATLVVPASVRVPISVPVRALSPRAEHLDRCLAEVQRVLGIGLDAAATASGIDRGTVYAWRRRRSAPRPGTVGAVLRLHGLVTSAVAVAGEEATRAWFHAGDPSPLDMLINARGEASAVTAASRLMRRELTAVPVPPPNLRLAATVGDGPPLAIR